MFKKLLVVVVALSFLIIAGAYLLPAETEVSRSIVIEKDVQTVFPVVNSLKASQQWSPWAEKDPQMKVAYEGALSGVGAAMSWESQNPQVGKGSQKIIESQDLKMVLISLSFDGQNDANAKFELEALAENKTKLVWSFVSEHGSNPINRYMGLMFDTWVGGDYEKGLLNLKELLEGEGLTLMSDEESSENITIVDETGNPVELSEDNVEMLQDNMEEAQEASPEELQKMLELIEKNKAEKAKAAQAQIEGEKSAKEDMAKPEPVENSSPGSKNY